MGTLRQNKSTQHGKRYRTNYHVSFTLPSGKVQATIPNSKENKPLAEAVLLHGNTIEEQAWRYPTVKDWEAELYQILGIKDKVSLQEDSAIISAGFQQMVAEKIKLNTISSRTATSCYRYAEQYLIQALRDKAIRQIARKDKAQILQTMEASGLTAGGINNYNKTIMTFLRWCVKNELLGKLPFTLEQIKQPSLNRISRISEEVFEEICQSGTNPIQVAYWRVCYAIALRKCEINPDKTDKHYEGLFHQCEQDSQGNIYLHVFGKGKKYRKVPLPLHVIEDYVTILQHRLHPSTISQSFKKAAIKAGYPEFHFHHTRHSGIANMLKGSDGNLFWVSKVVGHSKITTTMKYLRDEEFAWEMIVENKNVLEI